MEIEELLNKSKRLPTHYSDPMEVESIMPIGEHYKLRMRRIDDEPPLPFLFLPLSAPNNWNP